MPSTTPVMGLPYPLGTDPVADGDDAIKALAERIEARLPRGVIDVKTSVASTAFGATPADVPGMSITANLYAGRWYRADFSCMIVLTAAAGIATSYLRLDGAPANEYNNLLQANEYDIAHMGYVFQTTTGSHTIKVQASTNAGSVTFAGRPAVLSLQDIGPVSPTQLLREAGRDALEDAAEDTGDLGKPGTEQPEPEQDDGETQ